MDLANNLNLVRTRMSEALARSQRHDETVQLVAVTKTVGSEVIRELVATGQSLIGENRPQTLRDKAKELADVPVRWHFIGNLQTNKIKYVYPLAEMVHSIDREELLDEFVAWAEKTGRVCPCLLEVHISGEETKQGFSPDEILRVIERHNQRPGLNIVGLMGMAPFVDDETIVRASFRTLSRLFQESRALSGVSYHARELSMGMSDDYPIAIEEGATIVRVGRALLS